MYVQTTVRSCAERSWSNFFLLVLSWGRKPNELERDCQDVGVIVCHVCRVMDGSMSIGIVGSRGAFALANSREGELPSKIYLSDGNPDTLKADITAAKWLMLGGTLEEKDSDTFGQKWGCNAPEGPGIGYTGIPCLWASATNAMPGSDINGVPGMNITKSAKCCWVSVFRHLFGLMVCMFSTTAILCWVVNSLQYYQLH